MVVELEVAKLGLHSKDDGVGIGVGIGDGVGVGIGVGVGVGVGIGDCMDRMVALVVCIHADSLPVHR